MNNRRNFYRILHVQPEAPLEIIKSSYRSLMTKLKAHPDLGGDHATATLINQAYAILSDPQKRRQYDELLLTRKNQGQGQKSTSENSTKPSEPKGASYRGGHQSPPYSAGTALQRCLFCNFELPVQPNQPCFRCASPQKPARRIATGYKGELFGRRATTRFSKAGNLTVYPKWPHPGYPARLRDLSPTGVSLTTEYGVRSGQLLKLDSNILSAIARIITVRPNGKSFAVHASFLTVEFATQSGFFVSEKA